VQEAAEGEVGQIELFLNSVPLLSPLDREAKLKLVDAFVEEVFPAGTTIIEQGAPGDKFYIVKGWAPLTARARAGRRAPTPGAWPAVCLSDGRSVVCRAATRLPHASLQGTGLGVRHVFVSHPMTSLTSGAATHPNAHPATVAAARLP
jgi:hypothetical protein